MLGRSMNSIKCPVCGSVEVKPIWYAPGGEFLPDWIAQLVLRELIYLSEDEEPEGGPFLFCVHCHHRWGEENSLLREVIDKTKPLSEEELTRIQALESIDDDIAISLFHEIYSLQYFFDGSMVKSTMGTHTVSSKSELAKMVFSELRKAAVSGNDRIGRRLRARGYSVCFEYGSSSSSCEEVRIHVVPPR